MKRSNKSQEPYEQVGEYTSIYLRNEKWYVHYRLGGKPVRQSLKTTNKKEARRKAAAIERDLMTGQMTRPARAPSIAAVIEEYILHLEAHGRSAKTITKYRFCFMLVLALAGKRGINRIDQLDLAFVDEFRRERQRHTAQPNKVNNDEKSQTQDNSQ